MARSGAPKCRLTDAVRARQEHAENVGRSAYVRHGPDKLLRQREAPLLQQKKAARAR